MTRKGLAVRPGSRRLGPWCQPVRAAKAATDTRAVIRLYSIGPASPLKIEDMNSIIVRPRLAREQIKGDHMNSIKTEANERNLGEEIVRLYNKEQLSI